MGTAGTLGQVEGILRGQLRKHEILLAYKAERLRVCRDERDDLRTEMVCVACWEKPRCVALLPCKHFTMCSECHTSGEDAWRGANDLPDLRRRGDW